MLKIKQSRVNIILECYQCRLEINKEKKGVSRYLTSKNKKNNSNKLELSKYCKFCNKHTIHKEIK